MIKPVIDSGVEVTLAESYKEGMELGWNWVMMPKYDGIRAYWDGHNLYSRLGNKINAPDWWLTFLPKGVPADGELYCHSISFEEICSRVKGNSPSFEDIRYFVFDSPVEGYFKERIGVIEGHINAVFTPVCYRSVFPTTNIKEELQKYLDSGFEGMMLRQTGYGYQKGRTKKLLKVKPKHDKEVIVVGYTEGKGKYKGKVGGLVCEFEGHKITVGSGLTDKERDNPPPIGSLVTVEYQELTKKGVPRFPTFKGVRDYE